MSAMKSGPDYFWFVVGMFTGLAIAAILLGFYLWVTP